MAKPRFEIGQALWRGRYSWMETGDWDNPAFVETVSPKDNPKVLVRIETIKLQRELQNSGIDSYVIIGCMRSTPSTWRYMCVKTERYLECNADDGDFWSSFHHYGGIQKRGLSI